MPPADESDAAGRPSRSKRAGRKVRATRDARKGGKKLKAEDEAGGGPSASEGSPDGDPPSFEAALRQLEAVVDRLEGGDLELEAALTCFEEGVRLTRQCAEQLDAAERRIEILMKDGDEWVARPFAGAGESGPAEEEEADEGWED